MPMKPGMVFTIEPILAAGKPETFIWQEDDWTVATVDGKRCVIWGLWLAMQYCAHVCYDFDNFQNCSV